jgi:hypothetical protein
MMYISIFKTLMLLFELPYRVVLSTYLIFILMFLYMIQIHLSDSKILILLTLSRTVLLEGQHVDELYLYFLDC